LHLIDQLTRPELEDLLKESSAVHTIAGAVFNDAKRSHVDSIAFTVPQRLRYDGAGTTFLSGELVMLNSPQPKFACNQIRHIFRT
jgi:hypothetical protein